MSMNFSKEKKWLAASCLQKSIRNGLTDLSLSYAEQLYDIERAYLLYRLSIIMIEDIGIANIDLVHLFLTTEIKKQTIEDLGGKNFVLDIVQKTSESIKDRTAADLSHLSYFIDTYNEPICIETFQKEENIINKCLILWLLNGSQKYIKHSIQEEGNFEMFKETIDNMSISNKIKDIIYSAIKFHREPHVFALPICFELFNQEKNLTMGKFKTGDYIESKNLPIEIYKNKDGDWLNLGIDKHTREGAKALNNFIYSNTDIKNFLNKHQVPKETWQELIGHIIFRTEGHQVNKRLFYPTAVQIMKENQQNVFLDTYNISFYEIQNIIKQNINYYNSERKKISL